MTFLAARNIVVSRSNKKVIDNISIKIGPGELVGLIGPNGAGKTTLLKSLLGIVKLTEGSVCLNDMSMKTLSRNYVAKHLGYLAQGAPCYWPVTVKNIVELGCLPHTYDTKKVDGFISNIVADSMASTGISDLQFRKVTSLSGGERTLTMLARCLAGQAPLLLADEPVTGLDPSQQIKIMQLLKSQVSSKSGVVAVLHDLNLAAKYCSRLVIMAKGKIHADGMPATVLTAQNLSKVYGIKAQIRYLDGQPIILAES
jgi:iron complex transport system ATP-binding protein|tara:strand:+ start:997 stop:1764 length:768 start_codon:yes stop_codon:yes gene_type:complete